MSPDQPSQESIAGRYTIDTPEQMTLDFTLAGIGSRFLAMVVDTLIQAAVAMVLLVVVAIGGRGGTFLGLKVASTWTTALLVAVLFLLLYGYFAAFEIIWNGQTPGKRVVGIRVVKDSGRPLTPPEAIGRNLLRIVDQLPALYAVGMVVALANARNRRLGDFVAGSIVVREGSLSEIRPVWQTQAAAPAQLPGASALTVDDLVLLDTFLNRRAELNPGVRARMADEILRKLSPKLSLPAQSQQSAESTLEALAYQRRSSGAYS